MNHIREEGFVELLYSDAAEAAEMRQHLAGCAECRAEFAKLQQLMSNVPVVAVPERAEDYGDRIWAAVRPRLHEPQPLAWWQSVAQWFAPQRLAIAGGMALLLVVAFLAGRQSKEVAPVPDAADAGKAKERIVLVAVGRHLESSQMVLVELSNAEANGTLDITNEQERARDLLDANRLYRQSAMKVGDPAVNDVLDQLERLLIEIANGPSELGPKELAQLRERIQSQGVLFKVRVIGSKVREKEKRASSEEMASESIMRKL